MSDFDNTNKGAIWKNEDRQSDKHPHFRGSINVEGVDYWVSAWLKDKDANPKAPAMKFSVQKKEAQATNSPAQETTTADRQADKFDDFEGEDIPF
jgi:spermidine/putrescine-binding protein